MAQENKKPRGLRYFRRTDILVIAGLLAAAGLLWLFLRPAGQAGATARVKVLKGESRVEIIPLDNDAEWEILGADLPVHLEVKNGRIRFVDSVCPDHDCERFGWLARDGEWAACLPAGVTVTVEE